MEFDIDQKLIQMASLELIEKNTKNFNFSFLFKNIKNLPL